MVVALCTCIATSNVWFQKISIPSPPPHGRLFDLHLPPSPLRIFPFQGVLDDPSSPREFMEFLNGNFAYHPLEIQSGLGT